MNKNKQLAINMIAQVISFGVNLGINFFFTPYLIRTLGKETYGFFPLANNFISYITIITVALNSMANRFVTIALYKKDLKSVNTYFNSVLLGNSVIAGVFAIPAILCVLFLDKLLNVPPQILYQVQYLFAFIFISTLVSIVTNVFSIATFARNRLELASIRNIQSSLIRVACLMLLFWIFRPSIAYVGIAQLIVTIFLLIANIHYTRTLLPEVRINRKYFKLSAIKQLVSSGVWNSINQLSAVLLSGLDLMIANIMIDASASGEYAIVKTIPNFIQSLVSMLVGVFVPEFTILYAQEKKQELLKSINSSIKFMGLFITLPIGFLIVFGDTFYGLWVPGENIMKLHMLSIWTIVPMIITGSINTIFNVYTVTNKLKVPAIVLLLTGILNTTVVFVLLKTTDLGIFAIPITSAVIGILRNLFFTPIYASKCLHVKWNTFYIAILRGSICAVTMIVFCIICKKLIIPSNWFSLILTAGLCAVCSLAVNLLVIFKKEERKIILDKIFNKLKRIQNK